MYIRLTWRLLLFSFSSLFCSWTVMNENFTSSEERNTPSSCQDDMVRQKKTISSFKYQTSWLHHCFAWDVRRDELVVNRLIWTNDELNILFVYIYTSRCMNANSHLRLILFKQYFYRLLSTYVTPYSLSLRFLTWSHIEILPPVPCQWHVDTRPLNQG